jgi:hypothetical protein
MNIAVTEPPISMVAKTSGCNKENIENGSIKKVTYLLVDNYHSLCIDKRDIILAELEACQQLLKYLVNNNNHSSDDRILIEEEISQLKAILDFISR